ncbi:MAG: amidohydrolase family protein [Acidobacteria bacterium]|nr:amidohydrolase family protein [Acidobacteriota bacterium]
MTGAGQADEGAAELKARNVRVIYNLNFPVRSRALPPDADEPLATLKARANAPKVPAALDKAGVTFAFSSAGLRDPPDFVRNAGRAVREGLPADSAIRALTINAAQIAGAADRVGSLERGHRGGPVRRTPADQTRVRGWPAARHRRPAGARRRRPRPGRQSWAIALSSMGDSGPAGHSPRLGSNLGHYPD